MTGTSARGGGIEIKTRGCEPWKVCLPSPRSVQDTLQGERQEWLPLVVPHDKNTENAAVVEDMRQKSSEEEAKHTQRKVWRAEKKEEKSSGEWHNSVNPEEATGATGRSVAFPPVADYTEYTQ